MAVDEDVRPDRGLYDLAENEVAVADRDDLVQPAFQRDR
jgi:hypothetical protein